MSSFHKVDKAEIGLIARDSLSGIEGSLEARIKTEESNGQFFIMRTDDGHIVVKECDLENIGYWGE